MIIPPNIVGIGIQIKSFLDNAELAKKALIAEEVAKKKKQEQDAEIAFAIQQVCPVTKWDNKQLLFLFYISLFHKPMHFTSNGYQ